MSEIVKKNGKSFGKWLAAAALTALFVFNVAFTLEFNDKSFIPDVKITFLTSNNEAFASSGNNDCTNSQYGEGAYLLESNCVVTTSTYIFPIGWTVTTADGKKKCCTIGGPGAPPSSSCYANQETVCTSA